MEAPKGCCLPGCCPPNEICDTTCCKCPPGIGCEIKKSEEADAPAKPFSNCFDKDCVCITEPLPTEEVGGLCNCEKGFVCNFTKTEGPDNVSKVFFECGNGCKCEISACGTKVSIVKQDA